MRLHYKVESIKTNHHIVTKRTPFFVRPSRAADKNATVENHARCSLVRSDSSEQLQHHHRYALDSKIVSPLRKQTVSKTTKDHNKLHQRDQIKNKTTAVKIADGRSKTAVKNKSGSGRCATTIESIESGRSKTTVKIVDGRSKTAVETASGSGRSATTFVSNGNGRSRTSTLSSNERSKRSLPEPLTTTAPQTVNFTPNEFHGNSTNNNNNSNDDGGPSHNDIPISDNVGHRVGVEDLTYAVTDIQLSGVWKRVYDQKIERQKLLNYSHNRQNGNNSRAQSFDNSLSNRDGQCNFKLLHSNDPMNLRHSNSNKRSNETKLHSNNNFENETLLHSDRHKIETSSRVIGKEVFGKSRQIMELTETSLNSLDHTNENYLTSNIEDWINKVEEYKFISK